MAAEIMFENADNIRRDWPKLVRQGIKGTRGYLARRDGRDAPRHDVRDIVASIGTGQPFRNLRVAFT